MKTLSKAFYIGSYLTPVGSLVIIFIWAFAVGLSGHVPASGDILLVLFSLLVLASFLYQSIVWLVLIYKAWAAIQDGHARTSPGKAVGFLFIPFFNVYWMFQAYWGLAKDYNAYVDRHATPAPKLSEGLFLSLPILILGAIATWAVFFTMVAATIATAIQSGAQNSAQQLVGLAVSFGFFGLILPVIDIAVYVIGFVMVFRICNCINALYPHFGMDRNGSRNERAALYCLSGEFQGYKVPLPSEGIVIGRNPARAHLILHSDDVSAVHVQVRPDPGGGGVWIRDLQSTNGTYYLEPGGRANSTEWVRMNGETLLCQRSHFRIGPHGAEFEVS
jgi:hypothetical protein